MANKNISSNKKSETDKYRIDSHKLIYHVKRVNDWMKGKLVYPIYVEISLSRACNHRCTFCGLDFIGHQPRFLDKEILKKKLAEMAALGLKSIVYAGEGEPLLHKDIGDIINYTKKAGIDVALTTNASLYNKNLVDKTLGNLSWVKASVDAGTKEVYAKIHRTRAEDFDQVINNMSYAAKMKQKNGYKTTLGMQFLLLPENAGEVLQLAKIAKNIGMDYLVVKPFSQHPLSKTKKYKDIKYNKYLYLSEKLSKLNDEKFNVIFRIKTMQEWDKGEHEYKHCLALPFLCYIDTEGNVWSCIDRLDNKKFCYGNIYKNTFVEIWKGEKRKKLLQWMENKMDISKCRVNCRTNKINQYLWELKHPPEHVNFI